MVSLVIWSLEVWTVVGGPPWLLGPHSALIDAKGLWLPPIHLQQLQNPLAKKESSLSSQFSLCWIHITEHQRQTKNTKASENFPATEHTRFTLMRLSRRAAEGTWELTAFQTPRCGVQQTPHIKNPSYLDATNAAHCPWCLTLSWWEEIRGGKNRCLMSPFLSLCLLLSPTVLQVIKGGAFHHFTCIILPSHHYLCACECAQKRCHLHSLRGFLWSDPSS